MCDEFLEPINTKDNPLDIVFTAVRGSQSKVTISSNSNIWIRVNGNVYLLVPGDVYSIESK